MELLREWFVWGQSDLFFYGVIIIAVAALLPLRAEKQRWDRILITACLMVYVVCELVVTFWSQNWARGYLCLFLGGIAFSIAVGRLFKMAWIKFLMDK